jgi:hypothetical protein
VTGFPVVYAGPSVVVVPKQAEAGEFQLGAPAFARIMIKAVYGFGARASRSRVRIADGMRIVVSTAGGDKV